MRLARSWLPVAFLAFSFLTPTVVHAQSAPVPYGAPVTSEAARKAATAALAEGRKNGWYVAAAVVDTGGVLVHFERIEGTQNGSTGGSGSTRNRWGPQDATRRCWPARCGRPDRIDSGRCGRRRGWRATGCACPPRLGRRWG